MKKQRSLTAAADLLFVSSFRRMAVKVLSNSQDTKAPTYS